MNNETKIQELEAQCAVLQKGIAAVRDLIDDSDGVGGLHLNGDFAPWSELQRGGRFEPWLIDFNNAEGNGTDELES